MAFFPFYIRFLGANRKGDIWALERESILDLFATVYLKHNLFWRLSFAAHKLYALKITRSYFIAHSACIHLYIPGLNYVSFSF
jgi:hypothetical protein